MSAHAHETRSIRFAAIVLLAVSLARLVASHGHSLTRGGARDPAVGASLLDSLDARTTAAVADSEIRRRPLSADERLDPNVATEPQLDRLPGVGAATARAIVDARESGIVFGRPEDLVRVRGIGPATVSRMSAHLVFGGTASRRAPAVTGARSPPGNRAVTVGRAGGSGGAEPGHPAPAFVDINTAPVARLQELPGIGAALASRIVETRRHRPFSGLDDLTRVRGIGPATVERLRGRAGVGRARREPLR